MATVEDGRGITTVYGYASRDRMREVSATNFPVTYSGSVKEHVSGREEPSVPGCPCRRDRCVQGRRGCGRLPCDDRRLGGFMPGTR
ncbi:hypothetical protein SLI_0166 [Streptomyces lividans 1326]|uniref:Uncharacterized protein n=1 Tax=Streptomyces lividans 1326 TaxID=1200984 RepID=A0A7U9DMD2_STRLI|nr:hypothetical protein SLI_0166 [Streptomyces lividans 1326]